MRYTRTIEIHNLPDVFRACLQPGQHITAGGAPGRWCGQTARGTDVAAWRGNAARYSGGRLAYWRALRAYAVAQGARTRRILAD